LFLPVVGGTIPSSHQPVVNFMSAPYARWTLWCTTGSEHSTENNEPSSVNQSINQFTSNLAAREPDSKWYAVEITDKNSIQNKQCAYMYIGAGRDVQSWLGVTMLVGNGVGQRGEWLQVVPVAKKISRLM